ncbi:hypothetical protein MPC1_8260004 [Methylocella tundrae]|nr:hypothetical protein MPC1_8260004 [Methylocella tundrae]
MQDLVKGLNHQIDPRDCSGKRHRGMTCPCHPLAARALV